MLWHSCSTCQGAAGQTSGVQDEKSPLEYFGSGEAAGAGDVFQRGQRAADDFLCSVDDPLKSSPVCCPTYHSEMQYTSTLSMEEQYKATSSFFSGLFFLTTLRKCSGCCAVLTTTVLFADQERSPVRWLSTVLGDVKRVCSVLLEVKVHQSMQASSSALSRVFISIAVMDFVAF